MNTADQIKKPVPEFLTGGGEMGKLIREYDWSKTSLGPAYNWPQSLRTCIRIMLMSRQPIWIGWGKELITFYNDPYQSIVGGKHPWALGKPASIVWKDTWTDIEPLLQPVLYRGEGTYVESQLLILERNGYAEENYYTFSYIPIPGDDGEIFGVFCTCTGNADRIISERHLNTLTQLGKRLLDCQSNCQIIERAMASLKDNARDFPFVLFYTIENNIAYLSHSIGLDEAEKRMPKELDLAGNNEIAFAFRQAVQQRRPEVFEGIQNLEDIPTGAFEVSLRKTILLPLMQGSAKEAYGFLVVGLNPYRLPDEKYMNFFSLISDQIATSFAEVHVLERERKRDIEQKFASDVLRENLEQYATVVNASDLGLWDFDVLNQKLVGAGKMAEIYGLASNDEYSISQALESIHPDDKNEQEKNYANILEGNFSASFTTSYRIIQKNTGHIRWIKATARSFFNDEGILYRMVGTVVDITEQKIAEDALIYRKALLEAQNEAVPDAMLIVDTMGNMLSYNMHFAELWKIPQNIIEAKDDTAALQSAMTQVVDPQGFLDRVLYCYAHPDEAAHDVVLFKDGRTIERYGNAVIGEDGTNFGWIWYFRDITASKQEQEKIITSEQRFQAAVKAVQGNLWTNNAKGEMEGEQPGWASLTGQTLEEYQKYGWASAVHPDDVQPTLDAWNEAVSEQKTFVFEHRLRRKSGDWGRYSIRAIPLFDVGGSIREWVGVHTDITEQRAAEEKIRESESRFQNLIRDATAAIMVLTGPEMKVEIVNEAYAQLIDLKPHNLLGKALFSVIPDAEEYFLPLLEQVRQSGEPLSLYDSPYSVVTNGKRIEGFLHMVFQPYRDSDKNILGVMAIMQDVTESVKAKKALLESEEKFRQMANLVPQIMWTGKPDGIIDYYNDRWYEYTGFVEKDRGFESWIPILHTDDAQLVMDVWYGSIQKGSSHQLEFRLKNGTTGEYRWFLSKALPIKDHQGTIIKWFGTCTDIHEQKTFTENLEALVEARTKELERSNEDLQQFAHVSSHDLKEPVRKIRTFSSRIKDEFEKDIPEKAKAYLSKIEVATERMYTMIDGVLLYSTLNAMDQKTQPVDLNTVMHDIETDLEVFVHLKEAVIEYDKLPTIDGSSILIYQLFYNLINNSLKFSKANVPPVIRLSSAIADENDRKNRNLNPQKDYVKIILKDNGIGFNQLDAERIFQTFSRLNSKDKYEGTGLGLALCKKITERHGGTISAKGMEGEGASFEVILPIK